MVAQQVETVFPGLVAALRWTTVNHDRQFRRRRQLHILVRSLIREPGFVGMNAKGRIDEIVSFGQFDSTIYLRRAIPVADGDHGLHTGFLCPSDYLFAIGSESFAIEMCVRVYKHSYLSMWGAALCCLCRAKARLIFD